MSLARKVLHSSGVNLLDHAVKFASLFLLTPIILDVLGRESYGIWLLVVSMVTYFQLLDLGITVSGTHFAAGSIGKSNLRELVSWLGTSRGLYKKMGGVVVALTPLLAFLLATYFSTDANRATLVTITLLSGFAVALRFFLKVYQVAIKAHVRYELIVWPSIIRVTLQSIAIWLALDHGGGLLALGIVMAISDISESITVALLGRRLLRNELGQEFRWGSVDKADRNRLFRHSGASFLTALGQNLRSRIDPLLVAKFSGVDRVSDYSIGARFLVFFEDIVNALLGGHLLAAFSQIASRDGKGSLNKIFLGSLKLATAISVLGSGAMLVFGRAFIERWVGAGFGDAATVLIILAPAYALRLAAYPAGNLLYSLGKHANLAAINFGGGLLNLLLSLALVWKIGFFGVVWATAIELVLVGLIVLPWVVCKVSGITPALYMKHFLASLFLTAAPVAAFWWFTRPLIEPDYFRLCLLGSSLGVVYLVWTWLVLFDADEKKQIKSVLIRQK